MTELAFLIDLLFNKKGLSAYKAAIVDRIKELEANPPAFGNRGQSIPQVPDLMGQAPSTLANLNRDAGPAPITMPLPSASARIVGGEKDTGGGTRGPRKF